MICTGCTFVSFNHYLIFLFGRSLLVLFLLVLFLLVLSFFTPTPLISFTSHPMIFLSLLLLLIQCSSCLSFSSYALPVSPSLGGNGASPDNLLALAVIAARERASLGEISFALETEWGRHVATTQVVQGEKQLQNILIK